MQQESPDAQLRFGDVCLDIEITMALDKNSRLYLNLQDLRDERIPRPVTGEELTKIARGYTHGGEEESWGIFKGQRSDQKSHVIGY
jgi:hypothetical protein